MKIFLDANVLYSIFLTDIFLHLHELGLCEVVWSTYVESEAERHVLADARDEAARQIRSRRFGRMRAFALRSPSPFRYSEMRWDSQLSPKIALTLPDPGDIPVARDAIASRANVLVTENTKDFPDESLASFRIVIRSSEPTLIGLSVEEPIAFGKAIDQWLTSNRQFPKTRTNMLTFLQQRQYSSLAQRLSDIWDAPPAE